MSFSTLDDTVPLAPREQPSRVESEPRPHQDLTFHVILNIPGYHFSDANIEAMENIVRETIEFTAYRLNGSVKDVEIK